MISIYRPDSLPPLSLSFSRQLLLDPIAHLLPAGNGFFLPTCPTDRLRAATGLCCVVKVDFSYSAKKDWMTRHLG